MGFNSGFKGITSEQLQFNTLLQLKIFLSSKVSKQVLPPSELPCQEISVTLAPWVVLRRLMRPECHTQHLPLSCAEYQIAWKCNKSMPSMLSNGVQSLSSPLLYM